MIVAPNNDGPVLWGAALILSLGVHAALVAYLASLDVGLRHDRSEVAPEIAITVIEQLDMSVALPSGVEASAAPAESTTEDVVAADMPDVVGPDAEPEPDPEVAEAPEVAPLAEPGPANDPVQEPQVAEDAVLSTGEAGPAAEDVVDAASADTLAEAEAPVSGAGRQSVTPPEAVDVAEPVEEARPDFAEATSEIPDFLPADGAGGGGGPGPAPTEVPGPPAEQVAIEAADAGPEVGVLAPGELAPAPDGAEPDLAGEPEVAPPEDIVVAALPPEVAARTTGPGEAEPPPETAPGGGAGPGAGVSDGAPEARVADSEELRQLRLLVERIRLLSDRPCLAALPRRHGDGSVSVEVVGPDEAGIEALEKDIFTDLDVPALSTRRLISQAQCAALDFLRGADDYPVMRLGIGLVSDPILRDATRAGSEGIGRLQAAVVARPGWNVTLLMIDDDGIVQDLTEYLFDAGGSHQIDVPVRRSGTPRDTRQILLALATAGPLTALRDADGLGADEVFASPVADLSAVPMAMVTVDIR